MHALSVRREEINIVAGRGAQKDKTSPRHTEGQNESAAHRRTKRVRSAQKDKMSPPLSGRGFVRSAGISYYLH